MKAFKNTALVASIGSVILTLSPNPFVVAGGLYVLGFGLAGEMAIGGIVFYEFCPPSKRYYITLLSLFLSIGSTSTTVIALLVSLLNSTPFYNWRIIVAVASVLEILTMIFRFFMHETPAFLISQNKQSAANRLLSTISMINTGKSLDEPGDSASVNPNEFSKEIGNEDEDKDKDKDKEKLIVKKENPIAKLFKAPLKKVTFTIGAVSFR
jgi:MFS family permease